MRIQVQKCRSIPVSINNHYLNKSAMTMVFSHENDAPGLLAGGGTHGRPLRAVPKLPFLRLHSLRALVHHATGEQLE
jgi:hypothetical protein